MLPEIAEKNTANRLLFEKLLASIRYEKQRQLTLFFAISIMESTVSFRMHHGTQPEKVPFIGNGIRLLELKREILERKKISGSLDFDLKVVDESGRGTKKNTLEC